MPTVTPEIRVTDSKARLTLPRSFANSTLLLEIRGDNEIVIRKAKVVPLDTDAGEPVSIKLTKKDWAHFMALLDAPAAKGDPLKKLAREFGTWSDGATVVVNE